MKSQEEIAEYWAKAKKHFQYHSEGNTKEVKILCGISGSGKSTLCKQWNGNVCSADHYFMVDGKYCFNPEKLGGAHAACLRHFVKCLNNSCPLVIVDNTNTTVAEVAPYAALALAYGYDLEIVILECNPDVASARNVHGVSKKVVLKQMNRLESLQKQLPSWWKVRVVDEKAT